jgi:predicted NAD-dependent protein-ADP-ribosyltransferase YbiA (DUF1768 family)
MKRFCSPSIRLMCVLAATAAIMAQAPTASAASTTAAPAQKLNWDEKFDGVVHDANNIKGFVTEYRWLSNFFLSRVEWEGRVYSSAEAAYQSGKYPPAERDVFTTLEPGASKKLADINPYDTAAWVARKERTMREVVWAKFLQDPELAKKLIATKDRYLEETNWWGDKLWGVYRGEGQNLLGKILMDTRAKLGKENAAAAAKTK